MKSNILLIIFCLTSIMGYSQDKIIFHNNDTLICNVIEVTEQSIRYKYPNEEVSMSLSKNSISKIIFKSGRIQEGTKKIVINDINDWEKVQVTNSESDVQGLVYLGEISAKSSAIMSADAGKQQQKAIVKLKKEAAERGAHIVLILNQVTTTYRGAPSVGLTGKIYGYK